MNELFNLSGRKALVTGSSRGIGRSIALTLAQHGADVMVHYAGNRDAAQTVVDAIKNMGRKAALIGVDLYADDAPQRIAEAVKNELGDVDILVLNASVQFRRKWDEPISRDEFDQQVVVNLRSAYELIQRLAPGMVERRWGRIVTVGSVQQYRPSQAMPPYAALKSALENLARNLARQMAPFGVTVNNLSPGVIATERNAPILEDPAYHQRVLEAIPMHRVAQPDECAGAALLLCSQAGSYITGIDLPVDGGLRLP